MCVSDEKRNIIRCHWDSPQQVQRVSPLHEVGQVSLHDRQQECMRKAVGCWRLSGCQQQAAKFKPDASYLHQLLSKRVVVRCADSKADAHGVDGRFNAAANAVNPSFEQHRLQEQRRVMLRCLHFWRTAALNKCRRLAPGT